MTVTPKYLGHVNVFVRDVELCLNRLSDEHAEMIQLIGLYDFSREEIAAMLRRSRTWVQERISEAVDALAEIFLQAGLLKQDRPDRRQRQVTNRSLPADVLAGDKKPCASVEASADGESQYAEASDDGHTEDVEAAAESQSPDGTSGLPPWPEAWTCLEGLQC